MRLTNKGIFIITLLFTANSLLAETGDFVGASTSSPAMKWQEGMVTGNGTIGGIAFGNPYNETVVITHHKGYLPQGTHKIVLNLAPMMPELKKAALEAGVDGPRVFHDKAMELTDSDGMKSGSGGSSFHPSYFLKIKMKEKTASNYSITQNFRTGEVVTKWSDSDGNWQRKLFISRTGLKEE
jgi:hypothetical protein